MEGEEYTILSQYGKYQSSDDEKKIGLKWDSTDPGLVFVCHALLYKEFKFERLTLAMLD